MWSKSNLLTNAVQDSGLGISLLKCVENFLKMNKLHLKDRFGTTMKVVDKLDPEDELHISLSAVGKMMLIPIFLSKDQVKELINHLQKVIENE
jgi:hypothetical protein